MHLYEFKARRVEATQRNSVSNNKKTQMAGRGGAEFETSLVYRIKLVLGQPRTQKNPVSERD